MSLSDVYQSKLAQQFVGESNGSESDVKSKFAAEPAVGKSTDEGIDSGLISHLNI